jgi:GT2 family glycosyltransferase
VSSAYRPWSIVHWDLGNGLPALQPESGSGGLLLVLWVAEVPLGHLYLPAAWLPLSEHELSDAVSKAVAPALGYHLWGDGFRPPYPDTRNGAVDDSVPDLARLVACDEPLRRFAELRSEVRTTAAASAKAAHPFSVIVCTRDRPTDLVRCLDALLRCDPPADEILVVDNAPRTDTTRTLVQHYRTVRYVLEPRPGLSVARNAGIRHASGNLIAFTDDDVAVHPSWVQRLRLAFDRPEVLAVTGLVLPAALDTEAQWIFEKEFGGFSQGYRGIRFDPEFFRLGRRKGVPAWRVGAGANMAFRREAFEQVGLFDERLGAGAAGCSEDSELWYRLLASGWTCRYDPTCVVFHTHRAELAQLRSQMYQYMRGHVATLLVQAHRHRHAGNLYRLLLILPKYYMKRILFGRTFGSRERFRMVPRELWGCLSGVVFFLRHRQGTLPRLASSEPRS